MCGKQSIKVAVLTALLAHSTFALAEDESESDFYIAPFGSYLHSDDKKEAFDGFGAGLAIGKEMNEYFNVEIRGFWQKYENDYSCCQNVPNLSVDGDSQLAGGTLDVQVFLQRDTFSPYLVAAVGGVNTDDKMNSDFMKKQTTYHTQTTSFIFESGIGATYQISEEFSLRSDIRYRLNAFQSDVNSGSSFHDMTINFGFVTGGFTS